MRKHRLYVILEAVNVKDEKALKRYINLLVESLMEREKANEQFAEIRRDIKVLAETMKFL